MEAECTPEEKPRESAPSPSAGLYVAGLECLRQVNGNARVKADFRHGPEDKEAGRAREAFEQIEAIGRRQHYPCIAALQSIAKKQYFVGLYEGFGEGISGAELRQDLLFFLARYKETRLNFLSFFAVYDRREFSETGFSAALWRELSSLCPESTRASDRDPRFSDDPEDREFCLSIGGNAVFVVGLFPSSPRLSRRFPVPALVFNVFEQFHALAREGKYEKMVETNRQRDILFQGDVNPMAKKYGEKWEAIQFSGIAHGDDWKCPFRRVPGKKDAAGHDADH